MKRENEAILMDYLKIGKDNTHEEVESAISYLKLRKIKRLLLQNMADLEKAEPAQQGTLFLTHQAPEANGDGAVKKNRHGRHPLTVSIWFYFSNTTSSGMAPSRNSVSVIWLVMASGPQR